MNKVELSGNLGKDINFVGTDPNNPIAKIRIITSESYRDGKGELVTASIGHNVTVFGWKAKQLQDNRDLFFKGSLIRVVGKINYSQNRTTQEWFTNIEVSDQNHLVEAIVRFKKPVQNQQSRLNHEQGYPQEFDA